MSQVGKGWYYIKKGIIEDKTVGPISESALFTRMFDGKLKGNTLLWHAQITHGQWVEAEAITDSKFLSRWREYDTHREQSRGATASRRAIPRDSQITAQTWEELAAESARERQIADGPQVKQSEFAPCFFCHEPISRGAKKCRYCGEFTDKRLTVTKRECNPGVAAVLNLIIPGAGFLYMGDAGAGIASLLMIPFVYFISWSCVWDSFTRSSEGRLPALNVFTAILLLLFLALPVFLHLLIVISPIKRANR